MVRQLFMDEIYLNASNQKRIRRAIAFGTHPEADPATVHPVTSAVAEASQNIRLIFDELLVGNYLEEIACRGQVDDDAWDTVPVGATPQDIANCATAADVLPTTCVGEYAVCVGPDPSAPVGVLDQLNGNIPPDGAADDTRLINGAVQIICDGNPVPLNQSLSYWQPSGTQLVPSAGGLAVLGPAIVLRTAAGMPTNADCVIDFADNVVDKQGIQVCAPPDGDIEQDCTPGDTSLVTFHTEAFSFDATSPANNQMGVALLTAGQTYAQVVLEFNVPPDFASLANVTITPALPAPTIVPDVSNPNRAFLRYPGGFTAGTTYTLTVPTTVTDAFGKAAPAPLTLTFTTVP
ncbi:MAG: Ig-like domain-containing protein [Kofleriaceae bacterium]